MTQNFDVLVLEGLFFLCTLLRVLRQGVSSSISFALTIINLNVVKEEFLGLADLSKAQTHYIYESAEVFVIDKYEDFMLRAL